MNILKISEVIEEMKKSVVKIVIYKKHFFKKDSWEVQGTGFFFKKNYILTNFHVIEKSKFIKVGLYLKDELWDAQVVGFDKNADICVLKVSIFNEHLLKMSSSYLREGDIVITTGMPHGLEFTSSIGIISSLNHALRLDNGSIIDEVIQFDANLSPGNSGGPLVNINCEVVGMSTLSLDFQSTISFALKINFIMDIVENILESCEFYE